jgi:tetratricopeptide (TPR) repeat protein
MNLPALKNDPNSVIAYNNLPLWSYALPLYDRAIEDYSAALRIDPNKANAYYNRGNAYWGKKDYRRARADYEKALQIDPNHTVARDNLEKLRGMGY